jgi:hypothetical protein
VGVPSLEVLQSALEGKGTEEGPHGSPWWTPYADQREGVSSEVPVGCMSNIDP